MLAAHIKAGGAPGYFVRPIMTFLQTAIQWKVKVRASRLVLLCREYEPRTQDWGD